MRLRCLINQHVPAVRSGVEMEPGVFVGPSLRYCSHCMRILPGTLPKVGDRLTPASAVVHVRLSEIDVGLMEDVVDLLAEIEDHADDVYCHGILTKAASLRARFDG